MGPANNFTVNSRPTWTLRDFILGNLKQTILFYICMLAYNILRIMGQESLKENDAPIKRQVQRKRIQKVIQNLITVEVRLIYHGRRFRLGFAKYSPWFRNLQRVYKAFAY